MNPRYLLDTNICIYLIRHQPPEVAARFAQCFVGDVAMSAITRAELEYGVACSGDQVLRNREALDAFLAEVPAMPFDDACALAYGPVRMATRERRRDALDKLIAAHALALDAILVTNNPADFAAYPGLRTENWVAMPG
ncbi:PIN domain-containing protein [Leptothrix sp. BB-4]